MRMRMRGVPVPQRAVWASRIAISTVAPPTNCVVPKDWPSQRNATALAATGFEHRDDQMPDERTIFETVPLTANSSAAVITIA